MSMDRILNWDGCRNVRDLGGLSTLDGGKTRWGAVVRSDSPSRLSRVGWSALYTCGIRTIITLRTHGMTEDELNFTCPYPDLEIIQAPIEDITDQEFLKVWAASDLWATPLYYTDALQRWPEKHAAVISAVARAQPGGVLFHCKRGHDRTGIIALLLALARVTPEAIVADYELSPDPDRAELLAQNQTNTWEVILSTLAGLDVNAYLLAAGMSEADLDAARARLL
jgi:protein-tyrosine phosphatase